MIDIILLKNLCHNILGLLNDGKQEMSGMDFLVLETDTFEVTESQHFLGLTQHGYFAIGSEPHFAVELTDGSLDAAAYILQIDIHLL